MTLEEVSQVFTNWRAGKSYPSEPTPKILWDHVRKLSHEYSRSEICKKLNISFTQFDLHCDVESTSHDISQHETQRAFIAVPLPQDIASKAPAYEVILQGERRSLHIKIPEDGLMKILPLMESYL